jgi:hypothetical protein
MANYFKAREDKIENETNQQLSKIKQRIIIGRCLESFLICGLPLSQNVMEHIFTGPHRNLARILHLTSHLNPIMKVLKHPRPILNLEKDEMIDIFVNCHTAGYDCLDDSVFEHKSINVKRIACGMTKPPKYDLSEVADFYPTYASLNSSIFESSIILTIWEHIENMSNNEYIGFLHTDIEPYFPKNELWAKIIESLSPNNVSLGVSFPEGYKIIQNGEWDKINMFPCEQYSTDSNRRLQGSFFGDRKPTHIICQRISKTWYF